MLGLPTASHRLPTIGCGYNHLTNTFTQSSIFAEPSTIKNSWLEQLQNKPSERRLTPSPDLRVSTRLCTSARQLSEHIKASFSLTADVPQLPVGGDLTAELTNDESQSTNSVYYVFELTEEIVTERLPTFTPTKVPYQLLDTFGEIENHEWDKLKYFGDLYGVEYVEKIVYGRKIMVVAQLNAEQSRKARSSKGRLEVKAGSVGKVSSDIEKSLNLFQDDAFETVKMYSTTNSATAFGLIETEVTAIRKLWDDVLKKQTQQEKKKKKKEEEKKQKDRAKEDETKSDQGKAADTALQKKSSKNKPNTDVKPPLDQSTLQNSGKILLTNAETNLANATSHQFSEGRETSVLDDGEEEAKESLAHITKSVDFISSAAPKAQTAPSDNPAVVKSLTLADEILQDRLVPVDVQTASYGSWIPAPKTLWTFRLQEMLHDIASHLKLVERTSQTAEEYIDLIALARLHSDKLEFDQRVLSEFASAMRSLNFYLRSAANQRDFFTRNWFLFYGRDDASSYNPKMKMQLFYETVLGPLSVFCLPSGVVNFDASLVLLKEVNVYPDRRFESLRWYNRNGVVTEHRTRVCNYFDIFMLPGSSELFIQAFPVDRDDRAYPLEVNNASNDDLPSIDHESEPSPGLIRFIRDLPRSPDPTFKPEDQRKKRIGRVLKASGYTTLRELYSVSVDDLFDVFVNSPEYSTLKDKTERLIPASTASCYSVGDAVCLVEQLNQTRLLSGHSCDDQPLVPTEVSKILSTKYEFDVKKRRAFSKTLIYKATTQQCIELAPLQEDNRETLSEIYFGNLRHAKTIPHKQLRFRIFASLWKDPGLKSNHTNFNIGAGLSISPPDQMIKETIEERAKSAGRSFSSATSTPSKSKVNDLVKAAMDVTVAKTSLKDDNDPIRKFSTSPNEDTQPVRKFAALGDLAVTTVSK